MANQTDVDAAADADLQARLTALDAGLEAARPHPPEDLLKGMSDPAAMKAGRLAMELAIAILAGVGLGYLADRALGTLPWLMVAGSLLGFGAGVLNAWRALTGSYGRVGFNKDEG